MQSIISERLSRRRRAGRPILIGLIVLIQMISVTTLGSTSLAKPTAEGPLDKKEFTWSFRCVGFGGFFSVDAETVRAEGNIPTAFELLGEETGTVQLFLAAFDCSPSVIDGEETPSLYSLATVQLSSHPGSYDFFQFTDSPAVHSQFRQMGVWIQHLHDMSVEVSDATGTSLLAEANIPWTVSPFRLSAVPALSVPDHLDIPDSPSDHWSHGPLGTVYKADNNCEGRIDPAAVTVEATPGSVMARILGTEHRVTPVGAILRLNAAAHVAFESHTQRPTECPTWD